MIEVLKSKPLNQESIMQKKQLRNFGEYENYAIKLLENLLNEKRLQRFNYQRDVKSTFKDPYILDFLDLKNTYLEHDIERACFLNPSYSRGLKSKL